MKKYYLIPILLFAFTGARAQFLGGVTIERRVLEERNDTLHMELDIRVHAQAMNSCQSLAIIPELSTVGQKNVQLFPYLLINGRNKARMMKRRRRLASDYWNERQPYQTVNVRKNTEELVEYVMDVPYKMWMDTASLRIRNILISCADSRQVFTTDVNGAVDFAPRTAYMPQLAVNFYEPELAQKSRRVQGDAYLDFPVGKSVILPDFRKNPDELSKIRESIRSVAENQDATLTGVYIEGYASPEGSYEANDRLSRDRAGALRQYIADNFDVDVALVHANNTAEDWDGLRTLVEDSTLPDKVQVLKIINSSDAPDMKEARLKKTASWFKLLLHTFPSLRRTDYQIDYTLRDYGIAEAKELAMRRPEDLSQLELFRVATSYEKGSEAYYDLFERMQRQYPEDATAAINCAAAMIERGDYATARRLLEGVRGDLRAENNLGALCLGEGNLEQARIHLERAAAAGVREAQYNLQELAKKQADDELMTRYLKRLNRQ